MTETDRRVPSADTEPVIQPPKYKHSIEDLARKWIPPDITKDRENKISHILQTRIMPRVGGAEIRKSKELEKIGEEFTPRDTIEFFVDELFRLEEYQKHTYEEFKFIATLFLLTDLGKQGHRYVQQFSEEEKRFLLQYAVRYAIDQARRDIESVEFLAESSRNPARKEHDIGFLNEKIETLEDFLAQVVKKEEATTSDTEEQS